MCKRAVCSWSINDDYSGESLVTCKRYPGQHSMEVKGSVPTMWWAAICSAKSRSGSPVMGAAKLKAMLLLIATAGCWLTCNTVLACSVTRIVLPLDTEVLPKGSGLDI